MIVALVIGLLAVSQFAMSIYTPSMPAMVDALHTDISDVQLSVAVYYLSFGVSQFFYGPLSDSFGRRKLTIVGLLIYLVGSLTIIIHPDIDQLLIGRLTQGLGVGVGMVVGRSILSDVYHGHRLRTISNIISIFVVIVPIVSPLLGGYLHTLWGWQASFYFLLLIGFCSFLLVIIYLPETNRSISNRLHVLDVCKDYWHAFMNVNLIKYCLAGSSVFAVVVVMIVAWPFFIVDLLGYTPLQCAITIAVGATAFISGSVINVFLGRRLYVKQLYHLGFTCLAIGASLAIALYILMVNHFMKVNLMTVMLPMLVMLIGAGSIFPNSMTDSLAVGKNNVGIASGIFSGFQMLSAGMISIIVSSIDAFSSLGIVIIVCSATIVGIFSYSVLPKWAKSQH